MPDTADPTMYPYPPRSPADQMYVPISALKQVVQNTMHPSEVAKVILQTVASDNPDFRYVVGKDAAMCLEGSKKKYV